MTSPEQFEKQVSRVKISTTAKQDATPEVSVVEGTTEEEMERIRNLAVETYLATKRDLGIAD